MNLTEYQKQARKTAIYLENPNNKIIYPMLGLIGECGEVAEKFKKIIRDNNGCTDDKQRQAIIKELGDICWYLANLSLDLNIKWHDYSPIIYSSKKSKLLSIPELIIMMNHQIGLFTHNIVWHNNNKMKFENKLYIYYISYILEYISELSNRFVSTIEEIFKINIKKLIKRQQNKTLHGSGDNR